MSRLWKAAGPGLMTMLLLCLPAAGRAATVTFNFNSCGTGGGTGTCSGPQTFTSGGYSIVATAFPAGNANLFAKNSGGDENGLGLTNDPSGDHEITHGSFIQLNLQQIPIVPLTITMGSTTGDDEWYFYESSNAGSATGTFQAMGGNEAAFTIDPTLLYLDVTAVHGNVLLSSLSFQTAATPEPSGLALLGTGVLGLAGAIRRKLKV